MPITAENNFFRIVTDNTEYQIKVDSYGVLKHIWYGCKTGIDMDYLSEPKDMAFSGNPYSDGYKRTFSFDTMPLEYSWSGHGDYRLPAVTIVTENGTSAIELMYEGYSIVKGKYSIPGLPAVYADDEEAETLEIYLKDAGTNLFVTLKYGVIAKYDIITRSAVIANKGDKVIKLENAMSVCLDMPQGKWDWIHFAGRHAMERVPERAPLFHGIQESSSGRGASSHQQNPTVVICSEDCTENSGDCYGAALMYSGSFKTQVELSQFNQTRLVMGINPDLFSWKLSGGDEFYTPEAIMTYSGEGLDKLSSNMHKIIKNNVCRGKYKNAQRPVLINNWEATYFDFDEEKLAKIAATAADLGVDMFVMDDGWFGKRNDDFCGLGDWFVNENKLKGGLKPLVDKINAMGMKFGIWFEPEMISEDSDLFRAHPDWAIATPEIKPILSRSQLLLDLTREDVRDYLFNALSDILNSANISYVKWDFNRSMTDWYTKTLTPETMGEMPHRYILGLYDLLERLTTAFPDVLFEGCSGGGGRFDAGMLYYTPQIWCSDDTDAYERTKIQYGTSFFYPVSTMGSHVSAVPNHQTGRTTPFETRAVTAMAGSFGYELDLNTLSDEEKESVKSGIDRFKKYYHIIHSGEYHRLSDPLADNYAAWEFVSEDDSEVLVHGMIFRTEPNSRPFAIKLMGLCPDKLYKNNADGKIYSGQALMSGGITVPSSWGDYISFEMYLTEVK